MNRIDAMRDAFDATFAEAPAARLVTEDFLSLRIGEDPYAFTLTELAGIHRERTVRRISAADPAFVGIATVRGAMIAVHDLGVLLGYAAEHAALHWLALVRTPALVGFAFEEFGAHHRLPREKVSRAATATRHLRGTVDVAGVPHSLLDVPSLLDTIGQRRDPRRREAR